ncbi:helix-turn-helix domain-containing protein [Streptomyces violascens]|uniref:helix-turn-helix domain-containing protein n=1 Tax=Streptomyces violascens TaxID=67381 RepID=UPI0036B8E970
MTSSQGNAPKRPVPQGDPVQATKQAIAARLRHIRRNHPDGPFSLEDLARHVSVSKRTLAEVESGRSNLTIETLAKIAAGLGIERPAYFLDEQVFHAVNSEFAALKQLAESRGGSVAMRSTDAATIPPELAQLLADIVTAGQKAQASLEGSDSSAADRVQGQ